MKLKTLFVLLISVNLTLAYKPFIFPNDDEHNQDTNMRMKKHTSHKDGLAEAEESQHDKDGLAKAEETQHDDKDGSSILRSGLDEAEVQHDKNGTSNKHGGGYKGMGQNNTGNHGGHDSSGGDHGHGKVRLVSWRWEEYKNTILFTLMILLVSLLKVGFHHVPKLAHHFPESCLLIIVGLVTGVIIHFAYEIEDGYFPTFNGELFFNILLPPIILDAAYSIYDEDFFLNLNAILVFAVIGTVFNIFSVGGLLYVMYSCSPAMQEHVRGLTLVQCLVFTSVISAVDPVAVLAIFDEIGVNMVLYFLVFGESLLNDGVSVVVYNTMLTLSEQEHITYDQYILAIISFFTVVLGGILIGSVIGILTSLTLRLTSRARVLEPLIIICMAYASYIFAELVHWSGIISLVACGIFQKRYAFINSSKKTYTTVKYGIKTLSATSDCIIFIFLGKVAANRYNDFIFDWGFIISTLVLMTLVRFIGVFSLSWLINQRRTIPINLREQFIMAYGGLRGAVGFSLIYVLFTKDEKENGEVSETNRMFLTTTLVVVFFTVFVQGGTIKPLVNGLKITRKAERDKCHIIADVNKKTADHLMAGIESIAGRLTIGSYYKIVETFDNLYVKKFLLSKKARDRLTLRYIIIIVVVIVIVLILYSLP